MRSFAVLLAAGCASYSPAPTQQVTLHSPTSVAAYDRLRSTRGPTRFAQVDEHLYRGGQPTPTQVALLHALGVRTIISLRTRDSDGAAEEAAARQLSMKFLRLSFSPVGTPDSTLLQRIIAELRGADAPVYVHCAQGRDRTSLVVALYRVWVNGWNPADAWQKEAKDFGHNFWLFRGLDAAFARGSLSPLN